MTINGRVARRAIAQSKLESTDNIVVGLAKNIWAIPSNCIDGAFPAYIVVVEFSQQRSVMVAFEKEAQAAVLTAHDLNAEPTRSVLHRSAASLAIDCGEFQVAERLIMTALTENPPQEIAEELKDLFIQINVSHLRHQR